MRRPFSLRVCDRFHYRVRARTSNGAVLYFITLAGSESVHEIILEVTATRIRDGFRTFVLSITDGDTKKEVEVVAVSGETRLFDVDRNAVGAPVVSFATDEGGSLPDPVPCHFALLDGAEAMCQRGGRPADVPAPPLPKTEVKGKIVATLIGWRRVTRTEEGAPGGAHHAGRVGDRDDAQGGIRRRRGRHACRSEAGE